jgi:hypothetical protein
MAAVPIFCPVCLVWGQVAVALDSRTGTCACGVKLLLDPRVMPADVTNGYPDKIARLRAPEAPALMKRWQRGDELWFRIRGSWISKAIIFAPDRFEQRTRLGTRKIERIANLRGFLPMQLPLWSKTEIHGAVFTCHALLETSVIPLFPFRTFDEALKASRELTEGLDQFREIGHPYRS